MIRELLAAKEACDDRIAELTTATANQAKELAATKAQLKTEREARAAALSVKAETENQLAALLKELESRKAALETTKQSAVDLTNQLKSVSTANDKGIAERASLRNALEAETKRLKELEEETRLAEEAAARVEAERLAAEEARRKAEAAQALLVG